MPIIIGPGTAATQEDGRPRSSTLNSHWKNKRLRKAIWEKSGMDSRRGIVQKAAPESAAPTTVNAPKTGKPGADSKPAIGDEQASGRKLAQNKTAEKPQGVTARKLPKGNRSQQRHKSLGS